MCVCVCVYRVLMQKVAKEVLTFLDRPSFVARAKQARHTHTHTHQPGPMQACVYSACERGRE